VGSCAADDEVPEEVGVRFLSMEMRVLVFWGRMNCKILQLNQQPFLLIECFEKRLSQLKRPP
jgi:hypothetical protein